MNVSVFETVIGMNLVAISVETINMTVSEQFLMPKCWIDFSTGQKPNSVLELFFDKYQTEKFKENQEGRLVAHWDKMSPDIPNTVLFYFGTFHVDRIQYYTQQTIEPNYTPGINEIDTVLISKPCGESVILAIAQFESANNFCLLFEENAINRRLGNCTKVELVSGNYY